MAKFPCRHEIGLWQSPQDVVRYGQVTPEQALAEVSGLFGSFKKMKRKFRKGLKSVGRIAKKTVKSPLLKVGVAGLAVAFPPVGVPAASALVTANAVMSNLESADKTRRELAQHLARNTAKAAKAGDTDAKRGLALLLVAKRMRVAQRAATKKWLAQQRKAKHATAPPSPAPAPRGDPRRRRRADVLGTPRRPAPKRPRVRVVAIPGTVVTSDKRCVKGQWVRARKGHVAGLLIAKSGRCFNGVWRKVA
jgi:hypothetical protein